MGAPDRSGTPCRVKICGITRIEDARLAVRLGADYLGFVFAESPRRVTVERVAEIIRELDALPDAADVERVGVFVDYPAEAIGHVVRETGITMAQLHGNEPPGLEEHLPVPAIRVLRTSGEAILDRVSRCRTPYILLEPHVAGTARGAGRQAGGTGREADWELASRVVRRFPGRRFFLAGGLGPHNVGSAVRRVAPFAVDASSGLETRPGIKSAVKMRSYIEEARAQGAVRRSEGNSTTTSQRRREHG